VTCDVHPRTQHTHTHTYTHTACPSTHGGHSPRQEATSSDQSSQTELEVRCDGVSQGRNMMENAYIQVGTCAFMTHAPYTPLYIHTPSLPTCVDRPGAYAWRESLCCAIAYSLGKKPSRTCWRTNTQQMWIYQGTRASMQTHTHTHTDIRSLTYDTRRRVITFRCRAYVAASTLSTCA
jgi:hypothetical protein